MTAGSADATMYRYTNQVRGLISGYEGVDQVGINLSNTTLFEQTQNAYPTEQANLQTEIWNFFLRQSCVLIGLLSGDSLLDFSGRRPDERPLLGGVV